MNKILRLGAEFELENWELKIEIVAPKFWKNLENVAPFAENYQNAAPFDVNFYGRICYEIVNYGRNCGQIVNGSTAENVNKV